MFRGAAYHAGAELEPKDSTMLALSTAEIAQRACQAQRENALAQFSSACFARPGPTLHRPSSNLDQFNSSSSFELSTVGKLSSFGAMHCGILLTCHLQDNLPKQVLVQAHTHQQTILLQSLQSSAL